MAKPAKQPAVAHAVGTKPGRKTSLPSLLRKTKGSGTGAARLIPFKQRTHVSKAEIPPPFTTVHTDHRDGVDQISDLSDPPSTTGIRQAPPPIEDLLPSYQSATSSLSQNTLNQKDDEDAAVPEKVAAKLRQEILQSTFDKKKLPKTPRTSTEKKTMSLTGRVSVLTPSPVTLSRFAVQQPMKPVQTFKPQVQLLNQQREAMKSPVTDAAVDDYADGQDDVMMQEGLSPRTDATVVMSTGTLTGNTSIMPFTNDSKNKVDNDKAAEPAKRVAFAKVKALLNRVKKKHQQDNAPQDSLPPSTVDGISTVVTSYSNRMDHILNELKHLSASPAAEKISLHSPASPIHSTAGLRNMTDSNESPRRSPPRPESPERVARSVFEPVALKSFSSEQFDQVSPERAVRPANTPSDSSELAIRPMASTERNHRRQLISPNRLRGIEPDDSSSLATANRVPIDAPAVEPEQSSNVEENVRKVSSPERVTDALPSPTELIDEAQRGIKFAGPNEEEYLTGDGVDASSVEEIVQSKSHLSVEGIPVGIDDSGEDDLSSDDDLESDDLEFNPFVERDYIEQLKYGTDYEVVSHDKSAESTFEVPYNPFARKSTTCNNGSKLSIETSVKTGPAQLSPSPPSPFDDDEEVDAFEAVAFPSHNVRNIENKVDELSDDDGIPIPVSSSQAVSPFKSALKAPKVSRRGDASVLSFGPLTERFDPKQTLKKKAESKADKHRGKIPSVEFMAEQERESIVDDPKQSKNASFQNLNNVTTNMMIEGIFVFPKEVMMDEAGTISDLDQSLRHFPLHLVEAYDRTVDMSGLDHTRDAQETISTRDSLEEVIDRYTVSPSQELLRLRTRGVNFFSDGKTSPALADSITESENTNMGPQERKDKTSGLFYGCDHTLFGQALIGGFERRKPKAEETIKTVEVQPNIRPQRFENIDEISFVRNIDPDAASERKVITAETVETKLLPLPERFRNEKTPRISNEASRAPDAEGALIDGSSASKSSTHDTAIQDSVVSKLDKSTERHFFTEGVNSFEHDGRVGSLDLQENKPDLHQSVDGESGVPGNLDQEYDRYYVHEKLHGVTSNPSDLEASSFFESLLNFGQDAVGLSPGSKLDMQRQLQSMSPNSKAMMEKSIKKAEIESSLSHLKSHIKANMEESIETTRYVGGASASTYVAVRSDEIPSLANSLYFSESLENVDIAKIKKDPPVPSPKQSKTMSMSVGSMTGPFTEDDRLASNESHLTNGFLSDSLGQFPANQAFDQPKKDRASSFQTLTSSGSVSNTTFLLREEWELLNGELQDISKLASNTSKDSIMKLCQETSKRVNDINFKEPVITNDSTLQSSTAESGTLDTLSANLFHLKSTHNDQENILDFATLSRKAGLIDLTGICSYDDLHDSEAVWLFDVDTTLNDELDGTDISPANMESFMSLAVEKLSVEITEASQMDADIEEESEIVATSRFLKIESNSDVNSSIIQHPLRSEVILKNRGDNAFLERPISDSNQSLVDELPNITSTVSAQGVIHDTTFNDVNSHVGDTSVPSIERIATRAKFDTCQDAEDAVCSQIGYEIVPIGTEAFASLGRVLSSIGSPRVDTSPSSAARDRYDHIEASSPDKYDTLDEDGCVDNNAAYSVSESSVASTDGFTSILAKMKRDIGNPNIDDEKRHQIPVSLSQSPSQTHDHVPMPHVASPASDIAMRRDFLEILFDSTEALICGSKQSLYAKKAKKSKPTEKRRGRKKSTKTGKDGVTAKNDDCVNNNSANILLNQGDTIVDRINSSSEKKQALLPYHVDIVNSIAQDMSPEKECLSPSNEDKIHTKEKLRSRISKLCKTDTESNVTAVERGIENLTDGHVEASNESQELKRSNSLEPIDVLTADLHRRVSRLCKTESDARDAFSGNVVPSSPESSKAATVPVSIGNVIDANVARDFEESTVDSGPLPMAFANHSVGNDVESTSSNFETSASAHQVQEIEPSDNTKLSPYVTDVVKDVLFSLGSIGSVRSIQSAVSHSENTADPELSLGVGDEGESASESDQNRYKEISAETSTTCRGSDRALTFRSAPKPENFIPVVTVRHPGNTLSDTLMHFSSEPACGSETENFTESINADSYKIDGKIPAALQKRLGARLAPTPEVLDVHRPCRPAEIVCVNMFAMSRLNKKSSSPVHELKDSTEEQTQCFDKIETLREDNNDDCEKDSIEPKERYCKDDFNIANENPHENYPSLAAGQVLVQQSFSSTSDDGNVIADINLPLYDNFDHMDQHQRASGDEMGSSGECEGKTSVELPDLSYPVPDTNTMIHGLTVQVPHDSSKKSVSTNLSYKQADGTRPETPIVVYEPDAIYFCRDLPSASVAYPSESIVDFLFENRQNGKPMLSESQSVLHSNVSVMGMPLVAGMDLQSCISVNNQSTLLYQATATPIVKGEDIDDCTSLSASGPDTYAIGKGKFVTQPSVEEYHNAHGHDILFTVQSSCRHMDDQAKNVFVVDLVSGASFEGAKDLVYLSTNVSQKHPSVMATTSALNHGMSGTIHSAENSHTNVQGSKTGEGEEVRNDGIISSAECDGDNFNSSSHLFELGGIETRKMDCDVSSNFDGGLPSDDSRRSHEKQNSSAIHNGPDLDNHLACVNESVRSSTTEFVMDSESQHARHVEKTVGCIPYEIAVTTRRIKEQEIVQPRGSGTSDTSHCLETSEMDYASTSGVHQLHMTLVDDEGIGNIPDEESAYASRREIPNFLSSLGFPSTSDYLGKDAGKLSTTGSVLLEEEYCSDDDDESAGLLLALTRSETEACSPTTHSSVQESFHEPSSNIVQRYSADGAASLDGYTSRMARLRDVTQRTFRDKNLHQYLTVVTSSLVTDGSTHHHKDFTHSPLLTSLMRRLNKQGNGEATVSFEVKSNEELVDKWDGDGFKNDADVEFTSSIESCSATMHVGGNDILNYQQAFDSVTVPPFVHENDSQGNKHGTDNLYTSLPFTYKGESTESAAPSILVDRFKYETIRSYSFSSTDVEPLDMEELFSRYDSIVKHMVVLDEDRLARVQTKYDLAVTDDSVGAIRATNSAPFHYDNRSSPSSRLEGLQIGNADIRPNQIPNEAMPHGSFDLMDQGTTAMPTGFEDRTILRNDYPEQVTDCENDDDEREKKENQRKRLTRLKNHKSHYTRLRSSASADSSHLSQKARDLRKQLENALETSAAIRSSQEKLGKELSVFKMKIQERRVFSPQKQRNHDPSALSPPIESSYNSQSDDDRSVSSAPSTNFKNSSLEEEQKQQPSRFVDMDIVGFVQSYDDETEMQYSDDEGEGGHHHHHFGVQQKQIESIVSGLFRVETMSPSGSEKQQQPTLREKLSSPRLKRNRANSPKYHRQSL